VYTWNAFPECLQLELYRKYIDKNVFSIPNVVAHTVTLYTGY
jgi:hypothetical protein